MRTNIDNYAAIKTGYKTTLKVREEFLYDTSPTED